MKSRSNPARESHTAQSTADQGETLADKVDRYCTSEFAAKVTRHFQQAKRKAMAERDAAIAKDQSRSA
jgi:hypothetical protein